MTTTYDGYLRALTQLRDLPDRIAADLDETKQTRIRADALANGAVATAEASASATLKAIEAQLAAARAALVPVAKSNLVPPRIRPSGAAKTATSGDVIRAQQSLAVAVNRLRQAVQSEISRSDCERERLARAEAQRKRLAREAAERIAAAAARRKRLIGAGIGLTLVLAVLIVVLVVSL
ncbi:MAG TPA: hypothetical protein VFQ44_03275 [Streptosporangiaceae bacterium]|nr:hypothetical protein [Streptosporangiaceae bacterium]